MVQSLVLAAGSAQKADLFSINYMTAYFLCIAAFIFAAICSIKVMTTFNKYNRVRSLGAVTAA